MERSFTSEIKLQVKSVEVLNVIVPCQVIPTFYVQDVVFQRKNQLRLMKLL